MPHAPTVRVQRPLGGLDILRLAAIVLVTLQHAFSLSDRDRWTSVRSVNIGQLGVALFLGISALLGSGSHRRPVEWLAQRLRRLYPPYWLTMIACFALAWATSYKPFGAAQFLSQMLGTGLFTHPGTLINVPTWFISLILLCYLGLFVARWTTRPFLVVLLFLAALLARGVSEGFVWPWLHLITFFTVSALTLACPEGGRGRGFLAVGMGVLLLSGWSIAFAYTGMTLLSIWAGLCVPRIPRFVTEMAERSYEFYLVHGVILIGMTSALPAHPVIAVACGVAVAALISVLLHAAVGRAMARPTRREGARSPARSDPSCRPSIVPGATALRAAEGPPGV